MNGDEQSPIDTEPPDAGASFAKEAGKGLVDIVLGGLSIVGFTTLFGIIMAYSDKQIVTFGFCFLFVLMLFRERRRRATSRMFGFAAIGATVALMLVGQCALILHALKGA